MGGGGGMGVHILIKCRKANFLLRVFLEFVIVD